MPAVKTNQDVIEGKFKGAGSRDINDMNLIREEYISWLAVPPSRREPKSQKKMAAHLGVTMSTLVVWKRDPRITNAVRSKLRLSLAISDLPDIVDVLKEQAMDATNPRSVQAAKLLLEMIEKTESDAAAIPLNDLSNEQLRDMAAKLHDEFDERTESA